MLMNPRYTSKQSAAGIAVKWPVGVEKVTLISGEARYTEATYGNGEFLQWLLERGGITPYMRPRDNALRKNNRGYGPEKFIYSPESN